jgi:hypothetical protein
MAFHEESFQSANAGVRKALFTGAAIGALVCPIVSVVHDAIYTLT